MACGTWQGWYLTGRICQVEVIDELVTHPYLQEVVRKHGGAVQVEVGAGRREDLWGRGTRRGVLVGRVKGGVYEGCEYSCVLGRCTFVVDLTALMLFSLLLTVFHMCSSSALVLRRGVMTTPLCWRYAMRLQCTIALWNISTVMPLHVLVSSSSGTAVRKMCPICMPVGVISVSSV